MQGQAGNFVGSELHRIREEFRQIILSVLTVSAKDGLTDTELIRDYRQCTGQHLPYTQLGYNSVYELMRSMPDVCFIRRHPNKSILLYFPVETDQTKDIARLVRGQKDTTKAAREARREKESRRNAYNRYYGQSPSNRNTFFDEFYTNRPTSAVTKPTTMFANGGQFLPHNYQNQIRQILEKYGDMSMDELTEIYTVENGFLFNYNQFGFNTFESAVRSLTHLVEFSSTNSGNPQLKLIKSNRPGDRTVPIQNEAPANQVASQSHCLSDEETNKSVHAKDQSAQGGGGSSTSRPNYASSHVMLNGHSKPGPNRSAVNMSEEEAVQILKQIIDEKPEGMHPTSLATKFKEIAKTDLDFERYGYSNLNDFISYQLHAYVGFDYSKPSEEPIVYKLSNRTQIEEGSTKLASKQLEDSEKQECLKDIIQKTLSDYWHKPIEKNKFCQLFERTNGWKFSPEEFGFASFDEFLLKFAEQGVFRINFDNTLHPTISYPGASTSGIQNGVSIDSNEHPSHHKSSGNETTATHDNEGLDDTNTAQNRKRVQAEFIQSHIVHTLDPSEILKSVAEKSTHRIIISNVINPTNFQIQLVENTRALDSLMDELEKLYYGIGASHFNMPPEYIQHDRLCAAVFDGDKNWHRCRITGYYKDQKSVRVQFIDYGGSSTVSINDLKFLAKPFDKLPIQAINARLHNLAPPVLETWHKNIIDYMLHRVKGKVFSANIVGVIEGVLSIECFQELPLVDKHNTIELSKKSLNQIILDECYAKFYDSKRDLEFKDFKNWQESIQKKFSSRGNTATNTGSIASSERDHSRPRENPNLYCLGSASPSTGSMRSGQANPRRLDEQSQPTSQKEASSSSDHNVSIHQIYLEVSNETVFKTKEVTVQLDSSNVTYNLLLIEGTTYVFWDDVANIFGVNSTFFKKFIIELFEEQEEDPSMKCLIVKANYNSSNVSFFRLLRSLLKASLSEIRADGGCYLCKYKGIYDLSDLVFKPRRSKYIKAMLLDKYKSRSSIESSSRRDTTCTDLS